MSYNKIFLYDGASLLETEILGWESTILIKDATHFVNLEIQSLVGKTIIINLPIEFNYERLQQFNKFIIRYPIKELDKLKIEYEYTEYDINTIEEVKDESNVSCLILNKYLLSNKEKINEIKDKKFLLGTDYMTNEKPNLIGYCILKNSYKKLYDSLFETKT